MCSLVSVQRISNGSTASPGRNSAPPAAQCWWSRPAGGRARAVGRPRFAEGSCPGNVGVSGQTVEGSRRRTGVDTNRTTRHRKKVDAGGLGRSLNLLFSGRFIGKRQLAEIGLERFHTAEVAGSSPAAPTNRPRERGTAARRGTKTGDSRGPQRPDQGRSRAGARTSRAAEGGSTKPAGRPGGAPPRGERTERTD